MQCYCVNYYLYPFAHYYYKKEHRHMKTCSRLVHWLLIWEHGTSQSLQLSYTCLHPVNPIMANVHYSAVGWIRGPCTNWDSGKLLHRTLLVVIASHTNIMLMIMSMVPWTKIGSLKSHFLLIRLCSYCTVLINIVLSYASSLLLALPMIQSPCRHDRPLFLPLLGHLVWQGGG